MAGVTACILGAGAKSIRSPGLQLGTSEALYPDCQEGPFDGACIDSLMSAINVGQPSLALCPYWTPTTSSSVFAPASGYPHHRARLIEVQRLSIVVAPATLYTVLR